MFFRVLPVLVTGRLPFAFFVSQIVLLIPRLFLVDVTHTAFLVKSSTSTLQKQVGCFNHRVGYHGCRQAEETVVMRG